MSADLKLSTDGKKWKVSRRGYNRTGKFWKSGLVFDTEENARRYYNKLIEEAQKIIYSEEGPQWKEVERINRWA